MSYNPRTFKANTGATTMLLLVVLALLSFGMAFIISQSGHVVGALIPLALLGITIAIFSFVFPLFGIYAAIIIAYFIHFFMRLLRVELPIFSGIDILIYITFVGLLVRKVIRREPFWNNQRSPILFMHFVLLGYFLLEVFNPHAVSMVLYFSILRRLLTLYIFLYCLIQLLKDYKSIRQFFVVWMGLTFITAAYGCYQQWVGLPAFELEYITANPLRMGLNSLPNGGFRKSSFLSGCAEFGLLMAASCIMALVFLLRLRTTLVKRLFFYVAVIIMALGMSYSGTRTATFMLTVEVVLYILMTINHKKTLVFATFFLLLVVAILIIPSYGNVTLNRLKSTFEISSDESLKVRDVNRKYIQPYIYSHPIGGGVASTGVLNAEDNAGHDLAGFPADSALLAVALEFGWIGLLLQCATYFFILQQGIKGYYRSRDPVNKILFLAATLALFGYIFAQYAQIAIGPIPGAFLYYGLIAIIIRLHELDKKGNTHPVQ
ncbi:MAG: O-antigen ligase family protein [Chitinophagaceae bacterium]|nr:O-antigen ligase family protein [Chitinophagaceae bacterium]MCW5928532.1 O-antigen ligase family protein [Chitinophagaceae bacterium]